MVRAAQARCCPRLGHALQPHAGGDGGGAPGRLPPLLRLLRDCLVLLLPGRLRGWLRGWRRLLGRLLRPGGARGEVAWTLHVEARSVAPPGGAVWLGGESGGERGEHCGCLHGLSAPPLALLVGQGRVGKIPRWKSHADRPTRRDARARGVHAWRRPVTPHRDVALSMDARTAADRRRAVCVYCVCFSRPGQRGGRRGSAARSRGRP